MNKEQLNQIKEVITDSIQIHVNGKIDILSNKLDSYITDDTEWKKRAEPVIRMGENLAGFGKVSLYLVGFVASVVGAILVVINLLEKKR